MIPQSKIQSGLPWVPLTLVGIGLALVAVQWLTPLHGDDLVYCHWMDVHARGLNVKGAIFRHWDWLNGRLANLLAALTLQWLPHWAVSVLCGVLATAMMWLELRLCRPSSTPRAMIVLALMVTALPWWDYMLMVDIEANYIWSSVAALLMLVWIDNPRVPVLALAAVAVVAGAMHESLSVSLLCGFAAVALVGRDVPRRWWCAFGAFALGAVVPLSSPSVWRRAMGVDASGYADGPWWWLVAVSCWIVGLMLIALCFRSVRGRCDRLTWLLAVAAAVSMAIVAVGGAIGRSGWFGSLMAIAVLCRVLPQVRLPRWVSPVVAVLILAHYAALTVTQAYLGAATRDAIERYQASADGIVHANYDYSCADGWWLLGKAVTPPRPGEVYNIYHMSWHYGTPEKMMLIVPSGLDTERSGTLDTQQGRWLVTDTLPADVGAPLLPQFYPTARLTRQGKRYTVTPLPSGLYLIAPWHNDLTINF